MTESSNQNSGAKNAVDASDIESLVATLASDDGVERQHAREALVACGQPAVEFLIETLNSTTTQVRWEAAKSLIEIPDAAAVPALIEVLADDNCSVRWVAGEALIQLGQEAVIPLLRAVIENTTRFREGAHHVLHHLAHQDNDYGQHLYSVVEALQTLEPGISAPVAAEAALNALRRA